MKEVAYAMIMASWQAGETLTTVKMYDTTQTGILERAKHLGYVEPKWYEFWRRGEKIQIFCSID